MALVKISTEKETLTSVREKAMSMAQIDLDKWNLTMFEVGCRFAEAYASLYHDTQKVYDKLIKNPESGFWPWWKLKFLQDDADYANARAVYPNENYSLHKSYMIGGGLLERQLEDFLTDKNYSL